MIVVFGSVNVDIVMRVEAMPRPGETILCPRYRMVAGGKGANQAVAAAKAGETSVHLFGKVGDDAFGRIVMEALEQSSVNLEGVEVSQGSSTGCAMICVNAQGENMITVASGANLEAQEALIPDFLLSKGNTLLLQMETSVEENWKLIRRAKKYGARVVLNLAPAKEIPQDILRNVSILVLNQIEATVLALHLGFEVISPIVAARRIATDFGVTCIVTLGKEGAVACSPERIWEVQAMKIDPIDTTAAGDAFVGILAAGLDSGMDLPHALRYASVGSGLACLNKGAQASLPTQTQIKENLSKVPQPRQTA